MTIIPVPGTAAEPADNRLFMLKNASDMTVTISERGAALRSWRAPDRYGRMADVLLADADGAAPADAYSRRWQGRHAEGGVAMALTAPGGAASLTVHYHLDDDGRLIVDYDARAELPTSLRAMANPYFNLNGGRADVGDHMLQIDAEYYVEVDAGGAPVSVAAVAGTPFDFRQPAAIGPRLRWTDTQIGLAGGFDHCYFVRNHFAGGQGALREVARVFDPGSGRRLQVYTTEAALQFCSGKRAVGLQGDAPAAPRRRDGFCLETHARPELMSAAWPHVILHPGQVYRQTTVYRLSLQA
jgi:aldose 1-epimerase